MQFCLPPPAVSDISYGIPDECLDPFLGADIGAADKL